MKPQYKEKWLATTKASNNVSSEKPIKALIKQGFIEWKCGLLNAEEKGKQTPP